MVTEGFHQGHTLKYNCIAICFLGKEDVVMA